MACSIIDSWNVALDRVRRLAHSLKRDIGAALSRYADSPMSIELSHDHANPRAMCAIAISVFPGAAFHFATT
jgi:hypothetical protein